MKDRFVLLMALVLISFGCDSWFGPDEKGEIRLSSEKLGTEVYHVLGYTYEDSEFYRFPHDKDPIPDIINEGTRVLQGGVTVELPSFTTPDYTDGFALVGEFNNLDDARDFYRDYKKVEENLQYAVETGIVEAFQVWVQKTSKGNYVKLLLKEVELLEGEGGDKYSEVLLNYTYQSDGSRNFPD